MARSSYEFLAVFRLEDLPGKSQLLFRRKFLVKFLYVKVIHIIALWCLIYSGDSSQVSGDEFFAEEE